MIQPTAQSLWGMKPPTIKPVKAQPAVVIVAPTFDQFPRGEAQTMRMKSILRGSLIQLGCQRADCYVK